MAGIRVVPPDDAGAEASGPVRLPWEEREKKGIAEPEDGDGTHLPPKPAKNEGPETDAAGRLMPPIANPDLPRELERDNSFMVLPPCAPSSSDDDSDSDSGQHQARARRRTKRASPPPPPARLRRVRGDKKKEKSGQNE